MSFEAMRLLKVKETYAIGSTMFVKIRLIGLASIRSVRPHSCIAASDSFGEFSRQLALYTGPWLTNTFSIRGHGAQHIN